MTQIYSIESCNGGGWQARQFVVIWQFLSFVAVFVFLAVLEQFFCETLGLLVALAVWLLFCHWCGCCFALLVLVLVLVLVVVVSLSVMRLFVCVRVWCLFCHPLCWNLSRLLDRFQPQEWQQCTWRFYQPSKTRIASSLLRMPWTGGLLSRLRSSLTQI